MNNERMKKYLPLFISIFMLVSFLGLGLFGSILLLTINGMDGFYYYFNLDKWGFTLSEVKLFWGTIVVVGWGAWFGLGVLVERIFKIQIFRRSLFISPPRKKKTKSP